MRFQRKVTVGLGTSLAILVFTGIFSFRSLVRDDRSQAWVIHTHDVLEAINALTADVTAAEAGYRGYVWTGDAAELDIWQGRISQARQDLAQVRELTLDNPEQQKNIDQAEASLEATIAEIEVQIQVRRTSGFNAGVEALRRARGWAALRPLKSAIVVMQNEEDRLRKLRLDAVVRASYLSKLIVVLGNLLGFLFLSLAGVIVGSEMGKRRRTEVAKEELGAIALDRANQLAESNKELEAFTYTAAHDLRAPLRHMQGFVNLLREDWYDKIDDDGRLYVDKVLSASRDMGTLLDDLLNFSRLSRVEIRRSRVELDRVVERICSDLRSEHEGRTIIWEISPLPEVEGDPALLQQALFNLIANAVKYTQKCGQARIEIGSVADVENNVTIFVRDNGAGFDMKYADKLFGVFQRLHRAEEFEGTGIGLAIVRRIVERHGGRAWAEGALGEGATFYISLPIGRHRHGDARVHTASR